MATQVYNQGFLELVNGTVAFGTDPVYVVLVSSGYTFSKAHTEYSNVSASEIVDADYAPQDVTGKTVALVVDDVLYDSADISFGTTVTIDATSGGLVFLTGDAATPAATDRLLFFWQLPASASSTNSEFAITTPNGIHRIQPSV